MKVEPPVPEPFQRYCRVVVDRVQIPGYVFCELMKMRNLVNYVDPLVEALLVIEPCAEARAAYLVTQARRKQPVSDNMLVPPRSIPSTMRPSLGAFLSTNACSGTTPNRPKNIMAFLGRLRGGVVYRAVRRAPKVHYDNITIVKFFKLYISDDHLDY
jgi:hypothetical protein